MAKFKLLSSCFWDPPIGGKNFSQNGCLTNKITRKLSLVLELYQTLTMMTLYLWPRISITTSRKYPWTGNRSKDYRLKDNAPVHLDMGAICGESQTLTILFVRYTYSERNFFYDYCARKWYQSYRLLTTRIEHSINIICNVFAAQLKSCHRECSESTPDSRLLIGFTALF